MGDIGLLKQGWNWLRSQKPGMMGFPIIGICARDKFFFFIDRHWPILYQWCLKLWSFTLMLVLWWRNCVVKGIASFIGLEYMALFVIMWSGFLSLTSTSYVYFVFSVLVSPFNLKMLFHVLIIMLPIFPSKLLKLEC